MLPTCFSLDKIDNEARLYMSEIIRTAEALKAFPSSETIQVTEFGAKPHKVSGWVSGKDLPLLKTVGDLISYLEANDNLELIDFSGKIGADIVLSTHDDGEVSFTVANEEVALKILQQFVDPKLLNPVVAAVVGNPGKYISIPKGQVKIFDTFEDWIADDERPEYY